MAVGGATVTIGRTWARIPTNVLGIGNDSTAFSTRPRRPRGRNVGYADFIVPLRGLSACAAHLTGTAPPHRRPMTSERPSSTDPLAASSAEPPSRPADGTPFASSGARFPDVAPLVSAAPLAGSGAGTADDLGQRRSGRADDPARSPGLGAAEDRIDAADAAIGGQDDRRGPARRRGLRQRHRGRQGRCAEHRPVDRRGRRSRPRSRRSSRPISRPGRSSRTTIVDPAALDPTKLTYGSVNGLVEAVGDTGHTRFLTPDEVKDQHTSLSGSIVGIGALMNTDNGTPIIQSVIPGGPADRAGLRSGDQVLERRRQVARRGRHRRRSSSSSAATRARP